jgi:ectoine hydroxylase-related dioxygenase (phytanoyl-CoA dioxygenase family)
MKKLLFIIAILFAVNCDAQTKIEIKNDTLIVPLGKVKYIKIGDKVYYIEVELKEVPNDEASAPFNMRTTPKSQLYNGGRLLLQSYDGLKLNPQP